MGALADALSRPALTVDGRDCTVADVASAALYLGEWSGVAVRAAVGLAELEKGRAPADEAVRAAAETFRRDRRLLAAEEMESWMARRGLTAGEWMRWIRADLARRSATAANGEVAPDGAALYAEAICSGAFRRSARWLAELLVAPAPRAEEVTLRGIPDPAQLGLLGVEPARALPVLQDVRARASALQEMADAVAEAADIGSRIGARQAEWLAIEYRVLLLPEESAAREALLCVRDDGMSLAEVATLADAEVAHEHALLSDVGPALQPHLLSATRGELIGPVASDDGGAAVLVVDAKVPPSQDDPEIVRRARRELLTAALDREISTRVVWHDRL